MPRIPVDSPQISQNVPGVNAPSGGEFSRVGNAIQNIGATVEQQGVQIFTSLAHTEATQTANSAYMSDRIESGNKIIQLKNQSPDGYIYKDQTAPRTPQNRVLNDDGTYRTITHEYRDWANDRYENTQKNLPYLASTMYQQQSSPFFSQKMDGLNNDVQSMKLMSFKNDQDQKVQALGDIYAVDPGVAFKQNGKVAGYDFHAFYDDALAVKKSYLDQVKPDGTGMYNQVDGEMESKKALERLSHDQVNGMVDGVYAAKKAKDGTHMEAAAAARAVLAGTDPSSIARRQQGLPTISDMMNPEQKAAEDRKLISYMSEAAPTQDLNEFYRQLKEYGAAAEHGDPGAESKAVLLKKIHEYTTGGFMQPGEASEHVAFMLGQEAKGNLRGARFEVMSVKSQNAEAQVQSMNVLKGAQATAKVYGLDYSEDMGRSVEASTLAYVNAETARIEHEKRTDFASFMQGKDFKNRPRSSDAFQMGQVNFSDPIDIQNHAGTIQRGAAQIDALYATNYGTNTDYRRGGGISQDASARIRGYMQNTSADIVDKGIDNYKKAWGPRYGDMIQQLYKDDPNFIKFDMALSQPTSVGRIALIQSAQGKSGGAEKMIEQTDPQRLKDIKTAVAKEFAPLENSMNTADPNNMNQRMYTGRYSSGSMEAAMRMAADNPGMSADDVAKNVYRMSAKGLPEFVKGVGKTGGFLGIGSHGNEFDLRVPPGLSQEQKDAISNNLTAHSEPEALSRMNIDRAPGLPVGADLSKTINMTRSWNYVQGPNGESGYNLVYQHLNENGHGNGVPIIASSNGRRIFIPLSEALKVPVNNKTTVKPTISQEPRSKM